MSISASTFALFLFLIPGFIFRYTLYNDSIVRRPIYASSTIYTSVEIIMYSVIIFIFYTLLCYFCVFIFNYIFWDYDIPVEFVEFNRNLYIFHNNRRYEIVNFITNYKFTSFILFFTICVFAFLFAIGVQKLSRKINIFGRFMYGPLSPLLSRQDTAIITCFVLTKIVHENRRLMYAGYPKEVSLRDGSNIDHIIIDNPAKFYIRINRDRPTTTFVKSKPISNVGVFGESIMYISGPEIENVHFEAFYF